MQGVPHDEMLEYAGGDTDATFRLAAILIREAKQDTKNWNTFVKVQMPALRAFVEMEKNGLRVDKEALREFEKELEVKERELYKELIDLTPPAILRKHEANGWSFTSPGFLADCLFHPKGLGLKPLVFTKTTRDLPPEQRVPSTSAKDHLPFFESHPFVSKLMRYSKLVKMRNTYVGSEGVSEAKRVKRTAGGGVPARIASILEAYGIVLPKSRAVRCRRQLELFADEPSGPTEAPIQFPLTITVNSKHTIHVDKCGNITEARISPPSGFYQNLLYGDTIHASFLLHGTVTGRTSSRGPNLQNLPKRGELAKKFRRIFIAPEGYTLLEADLSQAEIRVAAAMADDKELIRVYKAGGDVHSSTAAVVMGISEDKFLAGRKDKTLLLDVVHQWPGAGIWVKTFGNNERKKLTVSDFCTFKRYQAKAAI